MSSSSIVRPLIARAYNALSVQHESRAVQPPNDAAAASALLPLSVLPHLSLPASTLLQASPLHLVSGSAATRRPEVSCGRLVSDSRDTVASPFLPSEPRCHSLHSCGTLVLCSTAAPQGHLCFSSYFSSCAHPRRTTSSVSHARRCGCCEGGVGLFRGVASILSPRPRPRPRLPRSFSSTSSSSRHCSGAPYYTKDDG